MVFDRSFVLAAEQHVVLEVVGDEPGLLSADGRESVELPVGSRVLIEAGAGLQHLGRGGPMRRRSCAFETSSAARRSDRCRR
jgi:hypothetical protein